ncbi:GMC family oxidoreductase [Aquabacterium sp. A7-Y]|uniref:GMC family oxidoreductase n=1 Tax=Aquabacterium sp. A7-Y TaxID=1349605 RepID=UPI00223E5B5B|nr:GMC family oxidoreductase [Aquabacterium sp. A7-Y]MCW7542064.1 GMC family oxidoreductase [Aquabacterium sp. A7-Y]
MSKLPDPIRQGLARGWKVVGGPHGPLPAQLDCDVVIVGTGAGGGITAELLARAGLDIVMVEAGPLKSSSDFRQLESEAYPSLYQESAARKTADKAITILQGRCVGGSTTVNWTSSFRTPEATLRWWGEQYGLGELSPEAMAPWFAQAERRLQIGPWQVPPNENNEVLKRGCEKLGLSAAAIPRNVSGCWNLGSCGMGCPTNAKQSMLVTTVPAALDQGARLLVETQALRFEHDGRRISALLCAPAAAAPASARPAVRIRARHYVLSGGAINSPALLLRSDAPDPHGRLGLRTFLHPVLISAATFGQPVQAWQGAPQSVYSDHFLSTQPIDGPLGYKLEAPPLHPVLFGSSLPAHGQARHELMADFPHTQALIALLRDGFHKRSIGGRVSLHNDGSPVLDYPLDETVLEGARRALLTMAEIQFAAGAQKVLPVHEQARPYTSWAEAREAIGRLEMAPYQTHVVSAHVMGGCGLSGDPRLGVVRSDGRHWQLDNLSVHDGSLFPTSIGANPQLSIYGLTWRLATGLAQRLGAKQPVLVS